MFKNKLFKNIYLFPIFFTIYMSYFIFYEIDFSKSNIPSIYSSVVGGSMAIIFIVPIYLFFLIKETNFSFNIAVLTRFDTYSLWLATLYKSISLYTFKFIFSLNLAFILPLLLLNKYIQLSDYAIYLFKILPIQFLILNSISLITCIITFCFARNYISFIIVYFFICIQYCFIRLLKISSFPSLSTLLFPRPEILGTFYIIYSYIIYILLSLIVYYLVSLIIVKKDIFWRSC